MFYLLASGGKSEYYAIVELCVRPEQAALAFQVAACPPVAMRGRPRRTSALEWPETGAVTETVAGDSVTRNGGYFVDETLRA